VPAALHSKSCCVYIGFGSLSFNYCGADVLWLGSATACVTKNATLLEHVTLMEAIVTLSAASRKSYDVMHCFKLSVSS
jgi:hypothetical protein